MKKISMIAAHSSNNVIGKEGTMPWHIKKDFAWFVKNTKNKTVVMGRKCYDDIVRFTNGQPLKDRLNVVLTTQKDFKPAGFLVFNDIKTLLHHFKNDDLMIIGGTQIYKQFLPLCNQLILTEIKKEYQGDTYFPIWDRQLFKETFRESQEENGLHFDFVIYDSI